jgi:hypothetical protein
MKNIYEETTGLCPVCAEDSPAFYHERKDGMYLNVQCKDHGEFSEKVESDIRFFKEAYEQEYERRVRHLFLPVTYRCNIKCKYCYTLSNISFPLVGDRPAGRILDMIKEFDGNVSLIGGEPTVREDLLQIISSAREVSGENKLSITTNGLRLRDIKYVKGLKEAGLDFVFLSFNDIEYDGSERFVEDKIKALDNCLKLNVPVWLSRTIDNLRQLDTMTDLLETYKKIVFNATIRTTKLYGIYYPYNILTVSDVLKHLKKEGDYKKGTSPFNLHIRLKGKKTKLCSWVLDMTRLDLIDSNYIISNDILTTAHRGMKVDEVLLQREYFRRIYGSSRHRAV